MSGRPPPPRSGARPPPKRGPPPSGPAGAPKKRTSMPPKVSSRPPPSSGGNTSMSAAPAPRASMSKPPASKAPAMRASMSKPPASKAPATKATATKKSVSSAPKGSAGAAGGGAVTKSAAAAALSAHLVKKSAGEISKPPESGASPSPAAPKSSAPKTAPKLAPVSSAPATASPPRSSAPAAAKSAGPRGTDEHKENPKMEVVSYDSLAEAVDGFLDGERTYVEHLQQGYYTFLKRLEVHIKMKKAVLDGDQINELFGNYYTIYNANDGLYKDLNSLRMKGLTELQNRLGQTLIQFIPYLRIYSDYIVKKDQRLDLLESLKTSSKKFREFVKINEAVIERKLKKVLQEPVERLVKYLSGMGAIYSAWEKEVGKEAIKQIDEAQLLFKAIVDVKQVTDEISEKCKDTKARRELGMLQTKVFGDKILLIAAHRLCMKWSDVKMVKKNGKSMQDIVLILCNDILIVGTRGSRFKGGAMLAVFPLIGLRIVLTPTIDATLAIPEADQVKFKSLEYRFAIIPQNTKFTPAESTGLSSIVIIVPSENELGKWTRLIEESVDEEEHNLRPTNPVDLEKRLRKEKTSPEGAMDKIQIVDPDKIRAIEEWKESRGGHRRRASKLTGSSIPSFKPGSSGGGLKSRSTVSGPSPSAPAPSAGAPKPGGHKKTSSMTSAPSGTAALISGMMKQGGPRLQSASVTAAPPKKKDSRSSLMAGIQGFKAGGLKSVAEEDRRSSLSRSQSSAEQPQDMASLLQNTLANYRTYVQDDEDSDDGSGSDWD